jgi:Pyridoxamine 5'-phosphate oxidase
MTRRKSGNVGRGRAGRRGAWQERRGTRDAGDAGRGTRGTRDAGRGGRGTRGTRDAGGAGRPGNRRADGYLNVLANPHAGILSLIPGRNETLRINGRARLLSDAPFFDELAVRGHRPIIALVIEIEQIFFHCAKSFIRSDLWRPASWQPDALPRHSVLVKAVQDTPETLEELDKYYAPENYAKGLY